MYLPVNPWQCKIMKNNPFLAIFELANQNDDLTLKMFKNPDLNLTKQIKKNNDKAKNIINRDIIPHMEDFVKLMDMK